jgi:formate-dependent nitrite reductase membrane component NrfD
MNPFVETPDWGWWIIGYFYLGGIAAGAYFTATLIDLLGGEDNHELARPGYWIAFPLIMVCGLFLTLDLTQPERFWHMLFKSETVHRALDAGWPAPGEGWSLIWDAFLLKYWSPMSVGSWALTVFGLCSFLSLLGSLRQTGLMSWLFRRSLFAKVFQVIGSAVGFFVASYTGALLTATNQPFWSDTTWIAPLFLASAASTGIAVMLLLNRLRHAPNPESLHNLDRADLWTLGLEAAVFMGFLGSLGAFIGPVLNTWQGLVMIVGTPLLGLLLPLMLHVRFGGPGRQTAVAAAVFALMGGFLLRYGAVTTPPALLDHLKVARGGWETPVQELVSRFSPEADRQPGKSRGADPLNRPNPDDPDEVNPPSKVFIKKR